MLASVLVIQPSAIALCCHQLSALHPTISRHTADILKYIHVVSSLKETLQQMIFTESRLLCSDSTNQQDKGKLVFHS
jgi:hypothetical protein